MICEYCGKEFEGKRSTAKYCSVACRVKAGRVSVTNPLSVTETEGLSVTNVTDKVSVTDTVSVTPDDVPWSPTFDLTPEGFARRNLNWSDFQPEFRADVIRAGRDIHADRQREIADTVKRRIEIAAEAINDPHIIGQQRMGA